jgi:hypothetical protein
MDPSDSESVADVSEKISKWAAFVEIYQPPGKVTASISTSCDSYNDIPRTIVSIFQEKPRPSVSSHQRAHKARFP